MDDIFDGLVAPNCANVINESVPTVVVDAPYISHKQCLLTDLSTNLPTISHIGTISPLLYFTVLNGRLIGYRLGLDEAFCISALETVGARPDWTTLQSFFQPLDLGCFEDIIQVKITRL